MANPMEGQSSPNPLFRSERLPVATIANQKFRAQTRNGSRRRGRSKWNTVLSLISLGALGGGAYILYQNGVFGDIIGSNEPEVDVPDRDVLDDVDGLISVSFDTEVSVEVENAFRQAALLWNQIIKDDLGSFTLRLRNGVAQEGCEKYSRGDTVNGIEIVASIADNDGPGKVLASAKPCLFEILSNSKFRVRGGIMTFDTADIEPSLADNSLSTVVLHEMGHVLGLGTLWQLEDSELVALDENGKYEYTGTSGVQAYNDLGGTGNSVPVESNLGTGSAGGHWAEDSFDSELMTPVIDKGRSNALSTMSIRALEDLGYTVDVSKAETYTIPSLNGATALLAPEDESSKIYMIDDIMPIDFTELRKAMRETKNLRGPP